MKEEKRRYVGIDLGKRDYTMAIIGRNGRMSIHKGTTTEKGRAALYRLLEKDDKVALEAGKLAFGIAREILQRVGSEVRVLNSAKLPVIWSEPTKTDKEDAMKLAHLVEERRDEKLPIVPLPSEREMERREVISGYQREVRGRTRVVNTPHSLFWKQGQTQIVRKDLATVAKAREAVKILTGLIREDAEWQLRHLELHEKRLGELRDRIKAGAKGDENMKRLQGIAGVGAIVAYAFVAHVGDGSRFGSGAQVSNFPGFVPKLDYSGSIRRHGPISKRGNGYLRGLLVQAVLAMVRSSRGGALKDRYIYLTRERGNNKRKTMVTIGRRMAELMYSIMRSKTDYEVRAWKKPVGKTAGLVEQARISA